LDGSRCGVGAGPQIVSNGVALLTMGSVCSARWRTRHWITSSYNALTPHRLVARLQAAGVATSPPLVCGISNRLVAGSGGAFHMHTQESN
jgi:hypothetical protein